MKVGVIVDNEFTHDIRVRNECVILSSAGYEVVVLALCFSEKLQEEEINSRLRVKRIKIDRRVKNIMFALFNFINIYSFWWSRKIKKFIDEEDIKIIHAHDLYMSKAVHIAIKKTNIPLILDLHENYPAAVFGYKWMFRYPSTFIIRPGAWEKKEKLYLKYPDKIIVLSETFKLYLLAKYSYLAEYQIIVFPNVPNLKEFNNYKIDQYILSKSNEFILFYFGGISKRRGIFVVLDALKVLVKEIDNIKLLLIGPVDKAEKVEFERAINDSKIKDSIIYFPWKDMKYLPSYINVSDVCLSPIEKNPQHESGVANKVFQYMLFGKPLIVSNCLPQVKIVSEEQCGLVFTWNSSIDLSEKVINLYNDRNLALRLGENGIKAIHTKFNTDFFGKKLIENYITKSN